MICYGDIVMSSQEGDGVAICKVIELENSSHWGGEWFEAKRGLIRQEMFDTFLYKEARVVEKKFYEDLYDLIKTN